MAVYQIQEVSRGDQDRGITSQWSRTLSPSLCCSFLPWWKLCGGVHGVHGIEFRRLKRHGRSCRGFVPQWCMSLIRTLPERTRGRATFAKLPPFFCVTNRANNHGRARYGSCARTSGWSPHRTILGALLEIAETSMQPLAKLQHR